MSAIEFLSHEEVCELTGARTKAGQITILKQNGIRHTIKLSGWPCVIVAAVTGTESSPKVAERPTWQPRKAG
ncbi:hypothetical protein PSCICO_48000 [Pseudomonas cichorii]|uniref:DUF4224 domain-containing protein n=1 Tax=Pseudomonas TaxID=286 RepID=UPI000BA3DFBD|nr:MULTISPECIES: DUF4224 domain-containing protein [Pseudomonas]GFM89401.1 hypothetical protein PSCICO_48000 [Pseudomonas cichorii]